MARLGEASVRRLKTPEQFQAVLQARPMRRSAHFALHGVPHCGEGQAVEAAQAWGFGVVVPKRWAKRAVTRNLIRRHMHMVFGSRHAALPPGAYVLRLRQAFAPGEFPSARSQALSAVVRTELQALLRD